jgi:hypothetical protein
MNVLTITIATILENVESNHMICIIGGTCKNGFQRNI